MRLSAWCSIIHHAIFRRSVLSFLLYYFFITRISMMVSMQADCIIVTLPRSVLLFVLYHFHFVAIGSKIVFCYSLN
jgi:hypothetical protein